MRAVIRLFATCNLAKTRYPIRMTHAVQPEFSLRFAGRLVRWRSEDNVHPGIRVVNDYPGKAARMNRITIGVMRRSEGVCRGLGPLRCRSKS